MLVRCRKSWPFNQKGPLNQKGIPSIKSTWLPQFHFHNFIFLVALWQFSYPHSLLPLSSASSCNSLPRTALWYCKRILAFSWFQLGILLTFAQWILIIKGNMALFLVLRRLSHTNRITKVDDSANSTGLDDPTEWIQTQRRTQTFILGFKKCRNVGDNLEQCLTSMCLQNVK